MRGKTMHKSHIFASAAAPWAAWLALGLSGCATVEGAIKLRGGPLGELEFKPSSCKSGQHYNFLGADLFAASSDSPSAKTGAQQPTFRVVNGVVIKDPVAPSSQEEPQRPGTLRIINDVIHGPLLRYFDPRLTDGYLQFTPEVCKQLRVDAENAEPADHNRSLYSTRGAIRLQCDLPDGTSASGALSFEGCQ
jgi:hypothetical protein